MLCAVKQDRPRLLLRPHATALAISLADPRALPRDRDVKNVLERLRGSDDASAQAMLWLMTGEAAAADKAIAKMQAYRLPPKVDTFHVYLLLGVCHVRLAARQPGFRWRSAGGGASERYAAGPRGSASWRR